MTKDTFNQDDTIEFFLRKTRGHLAFKSQAKPYVIFSDITLEELKSNRPQTIEDLCSISGFCEGGVRVEKYGERILSAIKLGLEISNYVNDLLEEHKGCTLINEKGDPVLRLTVSDNCDSLFVDSVIDTESIDLSCKIRSVLECFVKVRNKRDYKECFIIEDEYSTSSMNISEDIIVMNSFS